MSTPRGSTALWATLAAACWGFGIVATKALVREIPPLTLGVLQVAGGTALAWGLVVWRGRSAGGAHASGWPGIFEPGLSDLAGPVGLVAASASAATLVMASEPVLVAILAWLALGERLPARASVAILVASVGLALVGSGESAHAGTGAASATGLALVGLSTLFAAIYVVLARRVAARGEVYALTAWQLTYGLLASGIGWAIFALGGQPVAGWRGIDALAAAAAALSGTMMFGLSFLFFQFAVRHAYAGIAAAYLTLIPLFGVLGAVVFLGERPALLALAGGGLIVAALGLLGRGRDATAGAVAPR
jgi:drug/metabolite transporter (DMT)-like permease